MKKDYEFRCKECKSLVEFDSFGNFRCKKCHIVSKDTSLLISKEVKK